MAENGQLTGTFRVKSGMAQMLKGGVIMDVVNAAQARVAEEAGAVAVMALERVPADIRVQGGVARMSDPEKIVEIQEAVTIPVMAKARIGHVVEAVRHMRAITGGIRRLTTLESEELMTEAKNLGAPYDLVRWVAENGRLPVVLFTAGGIATPADAAMMMQLGADGVFVGSGIFKSDEPASRARAIVKATTHYKDPKAIAEASKGLGEAMVGKEMGDLAEGERLGTRGWLR